MHSILGLGLLCCTCLLCGCGESTNSRAESQPPPSARDRGEEFHPAVAPAGWQHGADWPRFLGPDSNSKSPETGMTDAVWDSMSVKFKLELGEGYATIAISDGKMYVFDRVDDLARLRCCDSTTGQQLWKFTYETNYRDLYGYDGGPRAQPIVDGQHIYLYGAEGMLHCLATADGKVLWKKEINAEYDVVQNFFGVGSCPYVYEDLLLVMVGGSDKASLELPPGALDRVRGNGTGIVAFDKRSGEEQWRLSRELASYSSPIVTQINGRPYGLAFMRGGLLAFDPRSGEQDFFFPWRSPKLESVNASNPVVVDDKVFISEAYGYGSALLQVTDDGCEVVWKDDPRSRDKAMQTHWNTPVHVDGYLYGSSGRHRGDAELRCIDLATGQVKWSESGLTRSSLMYVDGNFICLGEDGRLIRVSATPKEFNARQLPAPLRKGGDSDLRLQEPAWAAPVLAHGLLYVRGQDSLVCLQLAPQN